MIVMSEARPKKRVYPPLRPLTEEERELVLRNMGLVRSRVFRMGWAMASQGVKKKINRERFAWQCMDEFTGFGFIGLCIAAQRFDPSVGCLFSGFAYQWIHAYATKATRDSQVKIGPLKERERIGLCGVTLFTDLETERWIVDGAPDRRIGRADAAAPAAEATGDDAEHLDYLERLIRKLLCKRDAEVFLLRALAGKTLQQVAEIYGVSRQRIEQIEARAVSVLRKSPILEKALYEWGRNPSQVRRHEAEEFLIPVSEGR